MTCRRALPLALVLAAGCVDEVPTLNVSTMARMAVGLDPPAEAIPLAFGHYRWELVQAPLGVTDVSPTETTAAITVEPTTRGIYLYDRWFDSEASSQLSYHVVVSVAPALPQADIAGPEMSSVGEATTFDGNASTSPEQRVLAFQWRLAVRPEESAAVLANLVDATVTLTPDVAGDYLLELRVFDGELWSAAAAAWLTASAP